MGIDAVWAEARGPQLLRVPHSSEMDGPHLSSTVSEMLSGSLLHLPMISRGVPVWGSIATLTAVRRSIEAFRLTLPMTGLQEIRFPVNRGLQGALVFLYLCGYLTSSLSVGNVSIVWILTGH